MQININEMLELTAQIAEQLLLLKDTNKPVTPELNRSIHHLADLSEEALTQAQAPSPMALNPEIAEEQIVAAPEAEAAVEEDVSEAEECNMEADNLQQELQAELAEAEITPDAVDGNYAPATQTADSAVFEEQTDACVEQPETAEQPQTAEDSPETAEEQPVKVDENRETPEISADVAMATPVSVESLRRSLSINDVFLYRRTLFGGSAADMAACLEAIAANPSQENVRQQLRNRGADLRSDEAQAFIEAMTIL